MTHLCAATHRDTPPTTLGELRLCAGHHQDLIEALTGPSAATEPSIASVWGYAVGTRVVVCDSHHHAVDARDRARRAYINNPPAARTPSQHAPGPVVCGDGTTWHTPATYRPGGLARLYTALADRLTGQTTGEKIRGGRAVDAAAPAPDPVAELRSQIRHDLAYWAGVHIEAGNPIAPDRDAHPAALTAWLAVRLDWAAAQPWAGEYVDVLGELMHRGRRLIDLPNIPRAAAGPCPEHGCDGTLWSTIRTVGAARLSDLTCDTCSKTWDSTQWVRLGERHHGTPAQLPAPKAEVEPCDATMGDTCTARSAGAARPSEVGRPPVRIRPAVHAATLAPEVRSSPV